MSVEKVRSYLDKFGFEDRILEFDTSSATVALAAKALGVEEARIAKSISLHSNDGGCILVVTAGDCKIDNAKFKALFGFKPRMLSFEEALEFTGHAVGGVCPFALPEGVCVYLDSSLLRFDTVFPAAGSASSAVRLSPQELLRASGAKGFDDICKIRDQI